MIASVIGKLAAFFCPKEKDLPDVPMESDYVLKPFDVVLFAGTDPVANFIKRVTLHEVVPNVNLPFTELWTHSGILVDKTVLPLDCLEEGKLYIYESVFSGRVAGYVYSRILPVDHAVPKRGYHLGPQLRDFNAVVDEGTANVGICRLSDKNRQWIQRVMAQNPRFLLDLYNFYHDFSYPVKNILPVLAAASDKLYHDLEKFDNFVALFFNDTQQSPKSQRIFCSELVATLFCAFGLPTFVQMKPNRFTPLELEVAPEMERKILYAKVNRVSNLRLGNRLRTGNFLTDEQMLMKSLSLHDQWVSMPPGGGVPRFADPAGTDSDGTPLYIARCRIGNSFYLGKIGANWKNPVVTYLNREVSINFGHDVLVDLYGMEWVDDKGGHVPEVGAVKAGMDEDGEFLYIARGVVGGLTPVQAGLVKLVGATDRIPDRKCLAPGVVSPEMKGAVIPNEGKVVKVSEYQVLCYKAG
ncbi:hypothetical protein HDU78_011041 [Chytriomyces hyalinus]|nr:hypothetical protein HDU78_011041 [Chytriomyces hyalinus]